MQRKTDRNCHHEEGYVVVVVAVLLVVFVGFVALTVDTGFLVDSRTRGQGIADAAALAGAFTFVNAANPQPATATAHATAVATDQDVFGDAVDAADVVVTVDVPNQRVTVDLNYTEDTLFAQVLGFNTADIGVRGIAEAGLNATGSSCVKPWFLPNTILSSLPPCDACDAGELVLSEDGAYTVGWGDEGTEPPPFGGGEQDYFTIKPGNPQQSLAPGVFAAIRFPESQGGNDYRESIGTCRDEPVLCSESYQIEPGNMIGPTIQGVNALIGSPPDDLWTGTIGNYLVNGTTPMDTSKALVVAPIWSTCASGWCDADGDLTFPSGANTWVQVIGFATIFLKEIQGNDVHAYVVGVEPCENPGAGEEVSDEAAPYAIPVRLIRAAEGA